MHDWFSNQENEIGEKNQRGFLQLPIGKIYFELKIDQNMLFLQLLYEDWKQLRMFENWLGEC